MKKFKVFISYTIIYLAFSSVLLIQMKLKKMSKMESFFNMVKSLDFFNFIDCPGKYLIFHY